LQQDIAPFRSPDRVAPAMPSDCLDPRTKAADTAAVEFMDLIQNLDEGFLNEVFRILFGYPRSVAPLQ
jgi:hypothetical protein